MSNRFGMGILASLEDEEEALLEPIQEEETTLEEDIQEDADNIENAVAVDEAEVEKAEDQQDLLEDAADEMEELQETLEAMKTAGDVPAWAAKMFSQRLEHISRRTGARFATPSVESMGQSGSWTDSLEASLKENAAKAWEAIKKFFANMVEGFYRMMDSMFSGAERIAKRAGSLAAAVKGKDINADEAKDRLAKVAVKTLSDASFIEDGKPTFIAAKLAEGVKDATQVINTIGGISASIAEGLKKAGEMTKEKFDEEVKGESAEEVAKELLLKRDIFDQVKSGVFAKAVSSWVPGGVTFGLKEKSGAWSTLFGRIFRFEKKGLDEAGATAVREQVISFFGGSSDKVAALATEIQKATAKGELFSKDQFRRFKGELDKATKELHGKLMAQAMLSGSGKGANGVARIATMVYYRNLLRAAKTIRGAWLNGLSATLSICAAYAGV